MAFNRKAAILAACVPLLIGPAAVPALAAQAGGKVPLILNSLQNCERGADSVPGTGTVTKGSVDVDLKTGSVTAKVKLRDATPNATFTVRLIQVIQSDDGSQAPDCNTDDGTLTTDKNGAGTLDLTEAQLAQTNYVHVFLYTFTGGFHQYDTSLIPLG